MTIAAAKKMLEGIGPRVIVGLSGGKDSLVTLDLCVQTFGASNVHAFFMRLVDGLRCEQAPIRSAVARYNGLTLHVVPHWALSHMYRRSYLRPYVHGAEFIPALKQVDVENDLRRKTGIEWVAYGHRAVESLVRNAMLKRGGMNGNDTKGRRIYPIWDWKTPDVYAYLRQNKIPVPKPLASRYAGQSGGVELSPKTLGWIKEHYPDDFVKICEVFPFAPTLLMREAMHGDSGRQDTD